ncbi:MAG: hypothetical protein ACP5M7_09505, partial [Thermoproteota archaeon]
DDYVFIKDRKYVKKSGWLKYALACGISLELRSERVEEKEGEVIYHYTYRAIAPNGRFADAVGSASSKERAFVREVHDVRALAQTRAMERAISNLVGGGELGAEEIMEAEAEEVEEPKVETKEERVEVKAEAEKGLQDKELLEQLPWKSTKGAVRTTNWNEDAFLYVEEWGLDEAKQNFLSALVEKLKEAPFFVEGKWIWLDRNRYVKRTSEAPPAAQK